MNDQDVRYARLRYTATGALAALAAAGAIAGTAALAAKPPAKTHGHAAAANGGTTKTPGHAATANGGTTKTPGHAATANGGTTKTPASPVPDKSHGPQPAVDHQPFLDAIHQLVDNGTITATEGQAVDREIWPAGSTPTRSPPAGSPRPNSRPSNRRSGTRSAPWPRTRGRRAQRGMAAHSANRSRRDRRRHGDRCMRLPLTQLRRPDQPEPGPSPSSSSSSSSTGHTELRALHALARGLGLPRRPQFPERPRNQPILPRVRDRPDGLPAPAASKDPSPGRAVRADTREAACALELPARTWVPEHARPEAQPASRGRIARGEPLQRTLWGGRLLDRDPEGHRRTRGSVHPRVARMPRKPLTRVLHSLPSPGRITGRWLTACSRLPAGSGPARPGSRRTRPFHARGSAAHPGSAGWHAPPPRRPASRTPVRSPRHGSSGPPPPSPGP